MVDAGADIVMLPFFHAASEVAELVRLVDGRARVCLLVETVDAAHDIEAVVAVPGIDYVHIGLNDLHLERGMSFMFELVSDGTVERLCAAVGRAGISFGFGGIGRIGTGDLPAEIILGEHHRLGSSMVILSRTFCDMREAHSTDAVAALFALEVGRVRAREAELAHADAADLDENRRDLVARVEAITHRRQTPTGTTG